MAKSDKTGKPEKADTDVENVEKIIDAEVVEDTPTDAEEPSTDEDGPDAQSADAPDVTEEVTLDEDAVELTEPSDDSPSEPETEVEEQDDTLSEEADLEVEESAAPEEEPVETPSSEPEVAATPQPATVPQDVQKVGFFRVVLGGVVAAGLGFGLATYMTSQGMMPVGGSSAVIEELQSKIATQGALVSELKAEQAKIANIAAMADEKAAKGEMASAELAGMVQKLDEMALLIVQLEDRVVTAEKRPMTEGASAPAIDAYEREVAELRAMVSEQLAEAKSLKENSERSAQETLARAALARIISGLDSGSPYRAALTDLSSVSGVSVPSVLEATADTGVPTLLVLVEAYPDYAREALAEARSLETSEGGKSLTSFFKKQLGARSVTPKEGADPDAVLSRVEAAVREGRLTDALAELETLPDSSQALMAEWRQMAETRIAAQDAVESLSNSLTQN
ncbi:hypothetical protein CSC82_20160 [Rhodobacteraceae bacterium 4F10]|nr:hypothetical protein CSC82_20160 [Rhodobacteraceae bacterium 4F10]